MLNLFCTSIYMVHGEEYLFLEFEKVIYMRKNTLLGKYKF
jgi:hypothetical protein